MTPSTKRMATLAVASFLSLGAAGLPIPASLPVASAQAAEMQSKAASDLRLALNQLLAEHAWLAAAATGAALGGRDDEFKAAAGTLDENSKTIAGAIGSVYGKEAGDAFLPLWRKHIGFFVDYTVGKAKKDKGKSEKAVKDLMQYAEDFGAFLNSASPALPKQAVAELVRSHVVTLAGVVDAQARGDETATYKKLREAAHHMQMIADPLADTIVKQFASKFM